MEHAGYPGKAMLAAETLLPQQPPTDWRLQPTGDKRDPERLHVESGIDSRRCPSMAKGVLKFTAESPECGEVSYLALAQQAPAPHSGGCHLHPPLAAPACRPASAISFFGGPNVDAVYASSTNDIGARFGTTTGAMSEQATGWPVTLQGWTQYWTLPWSALLIPIPM